MLPLSDTKKETENADVPFCTRENVFGLGPKSCRTCPKLQIVLTSPGINFKNWHFWALHIWRGSLTSIDWSMPIVLEAVVSTAQDDAPQTSLQVGLNNQTLHFCFRNKQVVQLLVRSGLSSLCARCCCLFWITGCDLLRVLVIRDALDFYRQAMLGFIEHNEATSPMPDCGPHCWLCFFRKFFHPDCLVQVKR